MRSIPQFLIAAPTSGSGKTTVSRGLMALFVKKGLKVQPFKCGPDYIDTKYHEAVCGRPSINLDTFMASPEHVGGLYARYSADADVAVVEGMMGMYDGYDRDRGSSAEVARLLGIPVVLVVDAKSAAYSMAPLLSGFINFRPDIRIAGVIFNRVGSPRHYRMLQEVCEDLNVTCLGYLPKQKELEQESRHLGLDFSRSKETEGLDMLAGLLEEHVDWELLLSTTGLPLPAAAVKEKPVLSEPGKLHVSVARNEESFSFLYAEHLDILHRMGTVTFFNPEQDRAIPQETDLLYLPGGYPENRLEELAGARLARESIRSYIEAGGRTLAECGGMIYLSQSVHSDGDTDGGSAGSCAINVSGLISSQMSRRMAELAVRKAYGASRSTLMVQLLRENLALAFAGALLGFLFSCIFLWLGKDWMLGDGAPGTNFDVSVWLFLRPAVFVAVLVVCLLFNLLSVFIPAWHATRRPIAEVLGGE